MIDYFASDAGLALLAKAVIVVVALGILDSLIFVMPGSWRHLRSAAERTNGRRVFTRFMWWLSCVLFAVLLLFGAVAVDLMVVEDANRRAAFARLGLFFVVLLIAALVRSIPFTRGRMALARIRMDAVTEIALTAKDTNRTAHRIEGKLDGKEQAEDA